MPLIWKMLGYGGNALLFGIGLLALGAADARWFAVFIIAVAAVNLYLVRKIDLYSREEAWLAAEVRKRELRRQIEALDAEEAGREGGEPPKRIEGPEQDRQG